MNDKRLVNICDKHFIGEEEEEKKEKKMKMKILNNSSRGFENIAQNILLVMFIIPK